MRGRASFRIGWDVQMAGLRTFSNYMQLKKETQL